MANNPRHLRPSLISIYSVMKYYAELKKEKNESVFCFQVGANDGKSNDPVYEYFNNYSWKGLLIEPQYDVFHEGLLKTYANNKQVILENVALSHSSGDLPFYRVAISKARWATGLSGFDKKSLEGHIENGYIQRKAKEEGLTLPSNNEDLIEVVKVSTIKADDLFNKHHIEKLQVLCVDTEGYDFEILKLINLKKFQPELILFESKNLSNDDFIKAKKLLTDNGYELFWEKGDTLGIKFKIPLILKASLKLKAMLRKL